MSADNMIYVRKVNKHWRVWMGFASDDYDEPMPPKKAVKYKTRGSAMAYAHGWVRGEDIVEYGIIELPNIKVKQ
jgi:hypothetical protein